MDKFQAEALAAIRAGKLDLGEVNDAMRAVIDAGTASVEWQVDLGLVPLDGIDGVVTAETMTIGEMVAVAEATGQGWEAFNPIVDVRHAHALLSALVASRTGCDSAAASAAADKVTGGEFNAAYSLREQRPADPG